MAAGEGFEPSHTESESAVLPLHKPAIFARSCRTNRYYYTGKQEFVKGFFEKNNICQFQPFLGHFPRKIPAPRASSEADLVIPQVRSGAESAFSLNFICHQRPASLFVPCDLLFSGTEEIWTRIMTLGIRHQRWKRKQRPSFDRRCFSARNKTNRSFN